MPAVDPSATPDTIAKSDKIPLGVKLLFFKKTRQKALRSQLAVLYIKCESAGSVTTAARLLSPQLLELNSITLIENPAIPLPSSKTNCSPFILVRNFESKLSEIVDKEVPEKKTQSSASHSELGFIPFINDVVSSPIALILGLLGIKFDHHRNETT